MDFDLTNKAIVTGDRFLYRARANSCFAARLRGGDTVDLVKIIEAFITDNVIHVMGVDGGRRHDFQPWNRAFTDFSEVELSSRASECDCSAFGQD